MDGCSRLVILGDVCPTADYAALFAQGTPDGLLGGIADDIRQADYAVCNLECALSENAEKAVKCGPCLSARETDVGMLRKIGIRAVSLANNHIKDYGPRGVLNTMDALDANGIAWFGAGKDAASAADFHCAEVGGMKIGFVSFAEEEFNIAAADEPGAVLFEPYCSLPLVSRCRQACDYLVVLYHGGIEHYAYPSPLLRKKCRAMVEAGADLVLCQHSHCIGTPEKHRAGTILYGQGNGISGFRAGDDRWNEGLLAELLIREGRVEVKLRLLCATPDGIRYAPAETDRARMAELAERAQRLDDPEFLQREWRAFCDQNAARDRALLFGKGRVFNLLNRRLNNRLFRACTSRQKEMITMNLIRCDAWREVITTILEGDVYGR